MSCGYQLAFGYSFIVYMVRPFLARETIFFTLHELMHKLGSFGAYTFLLRNTENASRS